MIFVTSAGGNVGRRIISELVKQGLEVRAMDINPKANDLKEMGVKEVFIGDASDIQVMRKAMAGCDQVLYIPPFFTYIESKMAKICIDVAVEQGIRQFVMTSVTHPIMSTLLQHTQKRDAEEYLIYAGLKYHLNYTILQPMHYCHNFDVASVKATGVYNSFYDIHTKLSYVDVMDVAQVCAKVLCEDTHANATYELCGPDFYSPCDLVDVYNEISHSHAVASHIDVEDLCDLMHLQDSYGRECFRHLADTYSEYGIAGNPNVLSWLLQRKPTTFAQYVERELNKL